MLEGLDKVFGFLFVFAIIGIIDGIIRAIQFITWVINHVKLV